ncbi:MAG TPA: site-specific integrase [Acidimicrobiales bacterium]|nr:site-specific integrase [Acidimicrobiales bacterium]
MRKRGGAWELRAYVGRDPVTGRQTYTTRTFRGGKREAEAELARFVTQVAGGGHGAGDTTLSELIDHWLELAHDELSPSTLRGYERIIRSYIRPTIGKTPLNRLRTDRLDRFYTQLREKGGEQGGPLSPATVRQTHAVIRRALTQAQRWGWVASNPAALASPPTVRSKHVKPPEPEDVLALVTEAEKSDPDLGCLLLLAATTGARRGELCALRWSDVDLEAGTVLIERSLVENRDAVLVEKDTKTHSARRIALDEGSIMELIRHRDRCHVRAAKCGSPLSETGFVFSSDPVGLRPWVPNEVTKRFIRVRKVVGLPTVRLHDLRHFTATRLLAQGIPVRTVSGRLGHSNAATTLGVYAHFVAESDRDAAQTIGSVLDRTNAPGRAKRTSGRATQN